MKTQRQRGVWEQHAATIFRTSPSACAVIAAFMRSRVAACTAATSPFCVFGMASKNARAFFTAWVVSHWMSWDMSE